MELNQTVRFIFSTICLIGAMVSIYREEKLDAIYFLGLAIYVQVI